MKSSKSNSKISVVMKIIFEASVSWRSSQCHSLIDAVHWILCAPDNFSKIHPWLNIWHIFGLDLKKLVPVVSKWSQEVTWSSRCFSTPERGDFSKNSDVLQLMKMGSFWAVSSHLHHLLPQPDGEDVFAFPAPAHLFLLLPVFLLLLDLEPEAG